MSSTLIPRLWKSIVLLNLEKGSLEENGDMKSLPAPRTGMLEDVRLLVPVMTTPFAVSQTVRRNSV